MKISCFKDPAVTYWTKKQTVDHSRLLNWDLETPAVWRDLISGAQVRRGRLVTCAVRWRKTALAQLFQWTCSLIHVPQNSGLLHFWRFQEPWAVNRGWTLGKVTAAVGFVLFAFLLKAQCHGSKCPSTAAANPALRCFSFPPCGFSLTPHTFLWLNWTTQRIIKKLERGQRGLSVNTLTSKPCLKWV